jgi:transcriptional regulator with PAS, ATPase and Fis domain
VLSIHVPPLRERPADVKPLAEYFLRSYRSLNPRAFSAGADFFQALTELTLPGNVRQLENLVRQAIIQKNDDSPLNLCDLPLEVWRELSATRQSSSEQSEPTSAKIVAGSGTETWQRDLAWDLWKLVDANGWSLSQSLNHCERLVLQAALRAAQGNQSRTARLLGITPRSVYNKYRKHNLVR